MTAEILIGTSESSSLPIPSIDTLKMFDLSGHEKKIFAYGNPYMSPSPAQLFLITNVTIDNLTYPSFVCVGVRSPAGNIIGPLASKLINESGYIIEDITSQFN